MGLHARFIASFSRNPVARGCCWRPSRSLSMGTGNEERGREPVDAFETP